jgi:hypothetical protein
MLAPVVHILPLTKIRRERVLPIPGKVLVRRGQKVGSNDVVAEARLNPEHVLLNITRGLGLQEEEADKYLQCKAGMQVAKGDVLAGPVGVAKRVVRAPKDGRVIVAGGGQVLLEVDTPPYEVKAGLEGIVAALMEEHGAIIESVGALIQGVWGNGRIEFGLLDVHMSSPDAEISANMMDVSLRGSIILGGYCGDAETLKAAAGLPLRGLILSSMDASLIPLAERMRLPVIVIEGFGRRPLNTAAYKLLTTNDRREVSLNAQPWDVNTGDRPEIVIPLPSTVDPDLPPDTDAFKAGQQVRVISPPHLGAIGSIVDLRSGMTTLPSGVSAPAAEIQLESGEKEVLALANLEILE